MKILIVDDDEIVRDSLSIILNQYEDIEVIGTANNGLEALVKTKQLKPEIVLMDIQMPELDGINACEKIMKENEEVKIIMLTTFHDHKNIFRSLKAGAHGYILKSDLKEIQIKTIRSVYNGLPVITENALKYYIDEPKIEGLTKREFDILESVALGMSNKEIAESYYLSEGTVRNLITIILDKLRLRDRTQLAIYYWKNK